MKYNVLPKSLYLQVKATKTGYPGMKHLAYSSVVNHVNHSYINFVRSFYFDYTFYNHHLILGPYYSVLPHLIIQSSHQLVDPKDDAPLRTSASPRRGPEECPAIDAATPLPIGRFRSLHCKFHKCHGTSRNWGMCLDL